MPDDYDKSKNELLRKLKKMGEMAKEAKRTNKEFPASVVDELCHGAISAIKADRELSRGRKEKAIENMGAASSHINRVFSEVSRIISPGQDLFRLGKAGMEGKIPTEAQAAIIDNTGPFKTPQEDPPTEKQEPKDEDRELKKEELKLRKKEFRFNKVKLVLYVLIFLAGCGWFDKPREFLKELLSKIPFFGG